ncbi:MAG: nitronate monooxygenase [Victivallaceae bacterium]|nr:nitronate monooxygenase [Victivallaceae bacterium]
MSNQIALPTLSIGNITVNLPIIQGGMGVAVSSFGLASAVSEEGALGVVAAVGSAMACDEPGLSYQQRSYRGLRTILQKTRTLTQKPVGVNIMCALSDYDQLVGAAVAEHIEVIFSGAGLPLHLPALTEGTKTNLVPIVSSARAASILCRTWAKKYHRLPDALVVEGPMAGGHLGFSLDEIAQRPSLEKIVSEVLAYVKTVEEQYQCRIPVIAAGGIFTGADIARFLNLGAAGVQMGTRFVCTHECDASESFKKMYLDCREEDIILVKSPVGLPLRVIKNAFLDRIMKERESFSCTYHCLKGCIPARSPYCIAMALTKAVVGALDNGIVTCGANAYRCHEIVSVHDLLSELQRECLAEQNRL